MKREIIPKHIAIIPDGNRRWAKSRHLPMFFGHKKGVEVMENICYAALDRGVKVLTFWAFSTENWKRTAKEVNYLIKLFVEVFRNRLNKFHKENVKLVVSGKIEEFPKELQEEIKKAVEKTKRNTRGIVHFCLNYGGRTEIVDVVKKLLKKRISPNKVNQKMISDNLYTPGLPEPDLVIRTSGEQRLSGFLTWQSVYSELLFVAKHWPAFTEKDLNLAIEEFSRRNRRFGGN
ncbi:MAG: di-trans,poly-cis-decaprenylcistransferase [Candidatus Kerfeldbacteria bacterium CG08_land_8_20_14_0_20_40_16]|uniref:Isoprenyl transferase n=1 Tax=Candidatus Kerfeldbacteria bacterium CG08_land_8_20_14_0_20_40_16 TaxID=2014244 RepID=A0A2H0YX60_9BACT|nr:MAG: di-trans,poly-cis-decaprenylcistransferase [Candidatus Kerfeldbacteria bacterium CG08_land_8_20_14_0_20_40_16]